MKNGRYPTETIGRKHKQSSPMVKASGASRASVVNFAAREPRIPDGEQLNHQDWFFSLGSLIRSGIVS